MTSIQNILLRHFEESKQKNPAYSLRAYANKLGISSGALSSILNGNRKISKKMALKLARNINLPADKWDHFFESFSDRTQPNSQVINLEYQKIEMEHYNVISEWHHFAILSLLNLDEFSPEPLWIAKRIGISEQMARDAIGRMKNLGLIVENNGTYIRAKSNFTTSDDVNNLALRNAHKNNLKLAAKSLDEVPIELRDISAITMAIDTSKISLVKEKIRHFQDEMADILESGERNEVYKMCIQLFPITKLMEQ